MTFFDFGKLIRRDTKFAVFGIPWDYLSSLKTASSSKAPNKIRDVTCNLALTTELGYLIPEFKVIDLGNVNIEFDKIEKTLEKINEFVENIYKNKNDIIPIMIGGDHFCSYPVIKVVGDQYKKNKEFGVLIFDAHLDFYDTWDKGKFSHATVSHRVFDLDYINHKNILIVGTRDIDILELSIAQDEKITFINAYELSEINLQELTKMIIRFFKNSKIHDLYISIDIDVLDPSIAPGTGYAIPGGFTYREMWKILNETATNFNVVAFDLVEVAPDIDLPNCITSNTAAKIIIELISFIKKFNYNNN